MPICPKCGFVGQSSEECEQCGIVFQKFQSSAEISKLTRASHSPKHMRDQEWTTDPLVLTATAIPAALGVGFLAKYFFLTEMILSGIQIWIHEFGHAFMAWLSGYAATPLGIGWTSIGEERSYFVFACFAFLLGICARKSFNSKAWFPFSLSVLLLLIQLYFTFVLNTVQTQILFAYGGIGGEFYISTLLMISFYFRFPKKLRWDVFRFPVLLIGAYAFIHTYLLWNQISHREAAIPWGSMWGGEGDSGGDMNRLTDEFGWTQKELIQVYLKTGMFCLFALVISYAVALVRPLLKK